MLVYLAEAVTMGWKMLPLKCRVDKLHADASVPIVRWVALIALEAPDAFATCTPFTYMVAFPL